MYAFHVSMYTSVLRSSHIIVGFPKERKVNTFVSCSNHIKHSIAAAVAVLCRHRPAY